MTGSHFDIDRASDLSHACERWRAGDPRALSAFVLRHGVHTDGERRAIADALLVQPDARRGARPHTIAALADVERTARRIDDDVTSLTAWIDRLRARLARVGLNARQIDALLRDRRPQYARIRRPGQADVVDTVARRHGMDADALLQAIKRARRATRAG